MDNYQLGVKAVMTTVGAVLAAHFKVLYPILIVLGLAMAIDYFTGVAAAKYEKLSYPDDPTKGLSSKVGAKGIIKKLMYMVLVLVGLVIDFMILHLTKNFGLDFQYPPIFGLVVALWFICNELLSILENSVKMEVNIPPFLEPFVKALMKKTGDRIQVPAENEEKADD